MDKFRNFPQRVFINDIDTYASKNIAQFLSECMVVSLDEVAGDIEAEDDMMLSEDYGKVRAFHVVGTADVFEEKRQHVLEQYLKPNRNELLSKLMDCDVIINIIQHVDQVEEALWAVSALHSSMETFSAPKMFILVSTVMTWACSKAVDPDDPNLPLTDELFWRRKAHPNFKPHIDLEKMVVKMGKTNRAMFSTYVVASGLQYGMGEEVLHYFFKTSWLGKSQDVTVFGDGNNIVPMIHIRDLASVIQSVIQHQPKPYYLLAVDNSDSTMMKIAKTIACALGRGTVQTKPVEEAFLIEDLSVMEIDSMLVNLRMEAVHVKELFSINWLCASGLVKNIGRVVEEYRHTRRLLPIRICVLGPPAVGKSTVSKEISKHYKLHHIRLKETISQTISQLETAARTPDPDAENGDAAGESQRLLNSLKENMEQNDGVLEDQLLVKVVKDKLMSNPCKNQGFVLDGFPKTYEQARELFSDEPDSDEASSMNPLNSKRIMPECVVYLDASDDLLRDRVMNLPEKVVQEQNYEQDHFLGRLAKYRENDAENDTVLQYFDEIDIAPLYIEITSNNKKDFMPLMQKIYDTIGQPRNYGPSGQEDQEEHREDDVEERIKREALEKAEEERRASQWKEWSECLEEARRQEEEMLEAQSVPVREYLMEQLMPTLTQGLIECCKVKPQNPEDFLAEYLLKNNPSNF